MGHGAEMEELESIINFIKEKAQWLCIYRMNCIDELKLVVVSFLLKEFLS